MTQALGHRSVADCQRWVSSHEFAEWVAYDSLSPIGPERADLRAALIAQTMANAWRGKNQRAYSLDDFVLKFGGVRRTKETPEQIEARCMAAVKAYNAGMKGRRKPKKRKKR